MLEIIVIAIVFSKSGQILREKGWQKTLGWEFLGVGVFLLSLMSGGFVYGLGAALVGSANPLGFSWPLYIVAYLFAFIGVSVYFKLLGAFKPRSNAGQAATDTPS